MERIYQSVEEIFAAGLSFEEIIAGHEQALAELAQKSDAVLVAMQACEAARERLRPWGEAVEKIHASLRLVRQAERN